MNNYVHHSEWFYGHKVSPYGLEHGYVDYATLAAAFDHVMCNDLMEKTQRIGYWDLVGGSYIMYEDSCGNRITEDEYYELNPEEQEDYFELFSEVFQYFIVSSRGAEILTELTNELVWYNEELDMYIWGVAHWGTSWDYVLTDIKIDISDGNYD